MTIQRHSGGRTLWLFGDRLSLLALHCPDWPRGFRLYFHENGGRRRGECLDLNLSVGHVALAVTLWDMGAVSLLTRCIPAGPRGLGFAFGFHPAEDNR
jgi:hypothetical protein